MFFAFPLDSKPDWRRPPLLTILLIVVNCAIFFGPQRWEEQAMEKALVYYVDSQLPALELPQFVQHLRGGTPEQRTRALWVERALQARTYAPVVEAMERDQPFIAALRSGRILHPEQADYAAWREQRLRFEAIKGPPFTARWASIPADWNPLSLVSAAFLHGSTSHLLGNMVFLFVFGYTVELALGRTRCLAYYLLAGAGGEVGDLITRWGSSGMGLGASGAIAGLMAMHATLYGKQRIRFFYQLLFYFDYVKAPAIILLPIWIGHEFLQQWLRPNGGVAYMAHAGGLIVGALLIWQFKRQRPALRMPVGEAPPDPAIAERARALALVKALRLDEARAAYAALAVKQPQDARSVLQYFNLAKLQPASADFQRAAALVFALDSADPATEAQIHESFATYLQTAKPSMHLSPENLVRLAMRFAHLGQASDSARLGRALLASDPQHEDLPRVLLAASNALSRNRNFEAAAELARELRERFPQSAESRIAAQQLG